MRLSKTLWINDVLLQSMYEEADKLSPYETGGIFMGYQAENDDLVVTALIEAGPNATHRRFSFEPDHKYQLERIATIYSESGGDITYLGDWHTHPNSSPNLSLVDKNTLTKVALTETSHNDHPIMAILGGKPEKWTLNTVQFVSGQIRPWLLSKCIYNILQHRYYVSRGAANLLSIVSDPIEISTKRRGFFNFTRSWRV